MEVTSRAEARVAVMSPTRTGISCRSRSRKTSPCHTAPGSRMQRPLHWRSRGPWCSGGRCRIGLNRPRHTACRLCLDNNTRHRNATQRRSGWTGCTDSRPHWDSRILASNARSRIGCLAHMLLWIGRMKLGGTPGRLERAARKQPRSSWAPAWARCYWVWRLAPSSWPRCSPQLRPGPLMAPR